jgi:dephospho-CoA kinase
VEDISYLRELPHFKLIYINAELKTRYERIKKRTENSDDFGKTFSDFEKEGKEEPETKIRDLENYADHVVDNNGTYQDLYKQIDEIIKQYIQ